MFDPVGPVLRDVRTSGLHYLYPHSPLRVVNDICFAHPGPNWNSSFEILKDSFDATEMICLEAFDPITAADENDYFRQRRDEIWTCITRAERSALGLSVNPKEMVTEVIRLAARIHYRATALRIQHEESENTDDMRNIHSLIERIAIMSWKDSYFVYLWM